ncbi:MAG: hypothetical protein HUJ66_01535 [Oscillospiraceae bacterium]|nr:hypothetical protein [Oscillospiraceae bacterium]
MNEKTFWTLSQAVCVALWGYCFCHAARNKNPVMPAVLAAMHASEYLLVGRKAGAGAGVSPAVTLACTLMLGFTWWVPTKKGV